MRVDLVYSGEMLLPSEVAMSERKKTCRCRRTALIRRREIPPKNCAASSMIVRSPSRCGRSWRVADVRMPVMDERYSHVLVIQQGVARDLALAIG